MGIVRDSERDEGTDLCSISPSRSGLMRRMISLCGSGSSDSKEAVGKIKNLCTRLIDSAPDALIVSSYIGWLLMKVWRSGFPSRNAKPEMGLPGLAQHGSIASP